MKVIQRKRGGGKTTECYKKALNLLAKGRSVIFLNPRGTRAAFNDFRRFCSAEYLLRPSFLKKLRYSVKCSTRDLSARAGVATIEFMSYDEFKRQDCPGYSKGKRIIFDDFDLLLPWGRVEAVSVTKIREGKDA